MDTQEVLEHMFLPHPDVPPLLITKTEGVYLHDNFGRKIIDASGGPMAVNIGHRRKEVAEALRLSGTKKGQGLIHWDEDGRA